jgi:hypothetical protein
MNWICQLLLWWLQSIVKSEILHQIARKKKHFPHSLPHFAKCQHQIVNSTLPNWQLQLILYIACILSKLLIKCFFTSGPIPMTYSFFAQTYASKRFLEQFERLWIQFFLTFSTFVIVCSVVHNLGMWCQNSQVIYLNPKQQIEISN